MNGKEMNSGLRTGIIIIIKYKGCHLAELKRTG
jgi:hypothetical protein